MVRAFAVAFALVAAASAFAEQAPHQHGDSPHSGSSPYVGLESRTVKALSAEQMGDLRAGRGMGLALAAELNGYPGPRHVLDLADDLGLTADQRAHTEELFAAMKAEAVALGERLLAREAELDRSFAERRATPEAIAATTAEIGSIEGALRAAHLKFHVAMLEVLSPDQVTRYKALRGYQAPSPRP